MANASLLDAAIRQDRDRMYSYFGLKTLMDAYLHRDSDRRIVERPQYMHMRVAVATFFPDTDNVLRAYEMYSCHLYTHATPTLFNAGLVSGGLSSCFLMEAQDDLDEIFDTIKNCASISKLAGGIGISISKIRARGSIIKSTSGVSEGTTPLIQVLNSVAKYVSQGGRRNGAIAVYLEPWHADLFEFLGLRRNQGDESRKARDIFTALWVPDLFMRRVKEDGVWSMMCPSTCPGLEEVHGEQFDRLYASYEDAGQFLRQVRARDVWKAIVEAQIETGTPFVLFKDACNRSNNLSHAGTLRCSNLCAEVVLPAGRSTISVCNLASINLSAFVTERFDASSLGEIVSRGLDVEKLRETVRFAVVALNRTIDRTAYACNDARETNFAYRPLGIGIQGLADIFMSFGLPWSSPVAMELNELVMREIYLSALESTVELARTSEPYPEYHRSILKATGKLHLDFFPGALASVDPERLESIRDGIARYGVRNSTLTALMPTASTSQLLGNFESFEPPTSNLFQRSTQSGFFTIFNKYLVRRARESGIFGDGFIDSVIRNHGSVAGTSLPRSQQSVFASVWEIPQKVVIDMAAARMPFVDMSQSMNLYFATPTYQKLTSALFYAWEKGLKTGCYYLRTRPATSATQITVANNPGPEDSPMAASGTRDSDCLSCSS
jgi:ribonucleoside-diphosphate reductase subunit M1